MIRHHALLLQGKSFAESDYFEHTFDTTAEYEVFHFETLSIGDVRKIIQTAFVKPFAGDTKTMILEAGTIAIEAQHALLKVLEEPPITTKFILVLNSIEGLLPTLLSRVLQVEGAGRRKSSNNSFFTIFQTSSYAARLESIGRITKDKDVNQIDLLRDGVLWHLAQQPPSASASVMLDCVTKLTIRGASKKMLLEEIALTLPIVSLPSK